MTSILALDVSKSACGWAFGEPGDTPLSGVVKFGEPSHHYGRVGVAAMKWLLDMCHLRSPGIIAVEAAWMGNGGHSAETAALLIKLQGDVQKVAWVKTGREAVIVASSSARKAFVGKGRFDEGEAKHAVQREAIARGWLDADTVDPDRADALAVWCFEAVKQMPLLAHAKPPKIKSQPQPEGAF